VELQCVFQSPILAGDAGQDEATGGGNGGIPHGVVEGTGQIGLKQDGRFDLINEEALDPTQFVTTFPPWRGKSSKCKVRRKMKRLTPRCLETLPSPTRSGNSSLLSQTLLLLRIRTYIIAIEGFLIAKRGEEELWEIAKKLGVQFVGDESSVIHRFKELEDRDSELVRQLCHDREDGIYEFNQLQYQRSGRGCEVELFENSDY